MLMKFEEGELNFLLRNRGTFQETNFINADCKQSVFRTPCVRLLQHVERFFEISIVISIVMNAEDPLKVLEVLTDRSWYQIRSNLQACGKLSCYLSATEDIDIIFSRSSANEIKSSNALQSVRTCWISDEIDPTTSIEKTVPVSHGFICQSFDDV